MKVWEYLRDIKSTQATKQEIFDWFYLNRIDPWCCLHPKTLNDFLEEELKD